MFNRTYHVRAQRAAIGKLVAEGLLRPAPGGDPDSPFYRPANAPIPATAIPPRVPARRRKCAAAQLQLAFDAFDPGDAADVFHHMPVVSTQTMCNAHDSCGSEESGESFESDELLAELFREVGSRFVLS